jgi:hypothetical protein
MKFCQYFISGMVTRHLSKKEINNREREKEGERGGGGERERERVTKTIETSLLVRKSDKKMLFSFNNKPV